MGDDSLRSWDSPKSTNIGSNINVGILCRGLVAVRGLPSSYIAVEEEGVVVEVACVFCHFLVFIPSRQVSLHTCLTYSQGKKHIGNMLSYVCGMN